MAVKPGINTGWVVSGSDPALDFLFRERGGAEVYQVSIDCVAEDGASVCAVLTHVGTYLVRIPYALVYPTREDAERAAAAIILAS